MAKFISKKTKRRVFLIIIIAVAITLTIIVNVVRIWFQIIENNREENFLRQEMLRLQEEEGYLRVEVEKLQNPDYVARYAREKYLYSRDGEFTIKIP